MILTRILACFCILLGSFAVIGCEAGGGDSSDVVADQSEIERFLAENPNYDEGMDDGSEEESTD